MEARAGRQEPQTLVTPRDSILALQGQPGDLTVREKSLGLGRCGCPCPMTAEPDLTPHGHMEALGKYLTSERAARGTQDHRGNEAALRRAAGGRVAMETNKHQGFPTGG